MITLETLKADETNLMAQFNQLQGAVAQLGQVQGALAYNRQMQEFLKKQPSPSDNGEVAPINRIPATADV